MLNKELSLNQIRRLYSVFIKIETMICLMYDSVLLREIAQSTGAVEYTDCTYADG